MEVVYLALLIKSHYIILYIITLYYIIHYYITLYYILYAVELTYFLYGKPSNKTQHLFTIKIDSQDITVTEIIHICFNYCVSQLKVWFLWLKMKPADCVCIQMSSNGNYTDKTTLMKWAIQKANYSLCQQNNSAALTWTVVVVCKVQCIFRGVFFFVLF